MESVLPTGAAELISKLSSKNECLAILRFAEKKFNRVSRERAPNRSLDDELRLIQSRQDELEEEYISNTRELNMEYQHKLNPLYNRRCEIVAGVNGHGAGVPDFWLSALTADLNFKALISEQDAKVLKYLRDIRR